MDNDLLVVLQFTTGDPNTEQGAMAKSFSKLVRDALRPLKGKVISESVVNLDEQWPGFVWRPCGIVEVDSANEERFGTRR